MSDRKRQIQGDMLSKAEVLFQILKPELTLVNDDLKFESNAEVGVFCRRLHKNDISEASRNLTANTPQKLMKHKFIVIEGNIGAGKTSLTQMLEQEYQAKAVYEQFAENPFLAKFYEEPERYSFQLELSFLADRYQQLKNELSNRDVFRSLIVSDYYFSKSLIFGKNTLSGDEYSLYRRVFNIIYSSLPKPYLYVYLHKTTDKLLKNIRLRGREYEKHITPEYLKKIQDGYFEYFKQQKQFTFLIIDANNTDFVNSANDYKKIKDLIFQNEYDAGVHRISPD